VVWWVGGAGGCVVRNGVVVGGVGVRCGVVCDW
jgi:hypothetical protein